MKVNIILVSGLSSDKALALRTKAGKVARFQSKEKGIAGLRTLACVRRV